jgi:hypothetical protein
MTKRVFLCGIKGVYDLMQKTVRKDREKDASKGRGNSVKYCCDCEEATVHSTGSQLWVSCPHQPGWRSINSECNLPELPKKGE